MRTDWKKITNDLRDELSIAQGQIAYERTEHAAEHRAHLASIGEVNASRLKLARAKLRLLSAAELLDTFFRGDTGALLRADANDLC